MKNNHRRSMGDKEENMVHHNTELLMQMKQLGEFISRWKDVQENTAINQLFSETVNFLENCMKNDGAAQKIKSCVEEVGPVYATGNYMSPPIIQVKEGRLEVVCGILQNIKDSIARK
jgi:hypothetical protein